VFLPELLADLRLGDHSDDETGNPFTSGWSMRPVSCPTCKAAIRQGLDGGEFTVEDVAARLVGFAYVVCGPAGAKPASHRSPVTCSPASQAPKLTRPT